jgi:signal transduction histidine kinase/HAMP domain-containing protein
MLTLRHHILLLLLPLLLLLAGLGGTAVALLYELSGRIDAILHENYDSVLYMERLREALERIDSSFQFALANRDDLARRQYDQNWPAYLNNLQLEQNNVTVPGEAEEVERLTELSDRYRRQGDAFYLLPLGNRARAQAYFGPNGLLACFTQIKDVSGRILRMNQVNMEEASAQAQRMARNSTIGLAIGLAAVCVLGLGLAWYTVRAILRPIRAMTESALAIGAGNLDQVVPVPSRDELGRLAEAFNVMARQLRHYRRTDYARLFRAQQTSQATIDSFPDPVLVVDPDGRVEMANPAAQRLFGITARQDSPDGAPPWQPPELLAATLREALREERPYLPKEFEHAIPLHDAGQECNFLPRILPIRDPYGQVLGAAVLLQNVTRFRLLDQVKSDLVATASHELKTPLTSIRLALHLLLEEAVGPMSAKQTELVIDARDNAERLLAMVNNLLDLARLEQQQGQLDLRPEAPEDLLRAAAATIAPRAEDKGVALKLELAADLPPVAADRRQMEHALGNLLDNALKYTDAGGRITLSAEPAGDRVALSVADTGLGIAAEHLPHIFQRFYRIPGMERGSGTGLGLAIVREVVLAHGGAVTCESTPGVGSVFRLTLPIWSAPATAAASTAIRAAPR